MAYQHRQNNIINQQNLGINFYHGESFRPITLHSPIARKKPLDYNFTNPYVVTNYGRVFNYSTGRELTQCKTTNDYMQVALATPKGEVFFRVHELVASAWCDNKYGYTIPHHINCNRADNRSENILMVANEKKHKYLHSLRETDKTKYDIEIDRLKKENETGETYRCIVLEKDKSITFLWTTSYIYDLYCKGKITLEEIELSTENFKVVSKEGLV